MNTVVYSLVVLLLLGFVLIAICYVYDRKHNKAWVQLRELHKKGIYELPYEEYPDPDRKPYKSNSGSGQKNSNPAADKLLVADEIRKLKALLDEGILTQEEFDEQKKKLLNR